MELYEPPAGRADFATVADFQWALNGPGHGVQFYEDDDHLCRVVAGFLTDGLLCGQPVIALATPDHLRRFEIDLASRGFALGPLASTGTLTLVDAQDVLDRVMLDGAPDRGRFQTILGGILERAGGRRRLVRAYGEAVNVLWKNGQVAAALQLEAYWNELAADYHFALLCGYSIGNLIDPSQASAFEGVCGAHHRIVSVDA